MQIVRSDMLERSVSNDSDTLMILLSRHFSVAATSNKGQGQAIRWHKLGLELLCSAASSPFVCSAVVAIGGEGEMVPVWPESGN
jgi:hypothetical protein